jgi:hypothetical protein
VPGRTPRNRRAVRSVVRSETPADHDFVVRLHEHGVNSSIGAFPDVEYRIDRATEREARDVIQTEAIDRREIAADDQLAV